MKMVMLFGLVKINIIRQLKVKNMIKIKLPVDQIISDYDSGLSCRKIAEKHAVCYMTIKRRLKKAGVKIRPYARKFQGENALPMDEIIADYKRGMSPYKLGEKYGTNDTSIKRRLKKAGVLGCAEYQSNFSLAEARAKVDHVAIYDQYSQDTLDSICKFYVEDCKTIKEISQTLELPYHHIRHILHRQGVPVRSMQRIHTFDWDSIKLDLESGAPPNVVMSKYNIGWDMIVRCLGREYVGMGVISGQTTTEVKFKSRTPAHTSKYKERHQRNLSKRSVQRKSLSEALLRLDYQGKSDARVLCMPGKSCWDIDYFKSKSLVSEIVALEKDSATVEVIKEKHGDVEVHHATTASFFSGYKGESFDIIYLDYYSCFTYSVEQDLLLILENKIVSDMGSVVINFFGGREPETDQIRFKRHFNNLMRLMDQDVGWDSLSGNLKRVNAFNGFLLKYRRLPLFPYKENKLKKRKPEYCLCTRPIWYSYKTLSGKNDMLTGVFKASYKNRRTVVENSDWVVHEEEPFSPSSARTNKINMVSVDTGPYLGGTQKTLTYEDSILKFYEQNHYAPIRSELKLTITAKEFNAVVSKLGLLKRGSRPTEEQLLAELRRINEREGCVNYEHLQRAKIVLVKEVKSSNITRRCIALCEREGFVEGISRNKVQKAIRRYDTLKRFIEHLRGGGLKSTFSSRSHLRSFLGDKCDGLRAEDLLKETKEYLDLINVVY